MKNLKFYTLAVLLLFYVAASAQLEVDHPIQLTGSGANAKITGIQSVTGTQDAASVGAIQSGVLIYATATGTGNAFSINIAPAITGYQAGMVFNFISNQNVNGPATLNVNGQGAKAIKKNINHDLGGCEILNGQVVIVVYDGTNFQMTSIFGGTAPVPNAGPDQLNQVDTVITMAASNPTIGTGAWSIVSGSGGSFANTSSPTSTFTGLGGNSYVLSWTVTSFCSVLSDSVKVSFQPSGTKTFSYTGGQQVFTVPAGVSQITADVYGAQGGTVNSNAGGLGGYAHGNMTVTPGQTLYIYVGGHPTSTTGGFNGGGNGYGSYAEGGGGGSDIRSGGTALSNRIIVAGGGGGATYSWTTSGGTGGGLFGGSGTSSNGTTQAGNGGTQSSGGTPETTYNEGTAGTLGQGGTAASANNDDGGGGGGYYGGGGGGAGGGGGGSGYVGGVSNGSMQNGVQTGNGQIILTW